jgi:hypothetical protein
MAMQHKSITDLCRERDSLAKEVGVFFAKETAIAISRCPDDEKSGALNEVISRFESLLGAYESRFQQMGAPSVDVLAFVGTARIAFRKQLGEISAS